MNWIELILEVDVKDIETASNIAHIVSNYGIYVEDYSNLREEVKEIAKIDLIDEKLLLKNPNVARIHMYINEDENPSEAITFIDERLKAEKVKYKIDKSVCREEDWINNWKKYFKPTPIGEKLLIRPIWEENYDAQGRTVLNIEPGVAFGTGTHETTRLCLEKIERYVKKGDEVLDIGCGSGILSVASLLMGARRAIGVDIDEMAVKISEYNASLNNVEDKFKAVFGNLTDKITGKFNVIIANIVADVIIKLIQDVGNYMRPDSLFIMSGVIDIRVEDIKRALKDKFDVIDESSEKGWYALVAKKSENGRGCE